LTGKVEKSIGKGQTIELKLKESPSKKPKFTVNAMMTNTLSTVKIFPWKLLEISPISDPELKSIQL